MTNTRLVHVVDDDEAVRESAAILLESAGYEVATHASGVAFLEGLEGAAPGCLLLDIHMPGMTGLQVQVELKARKMTWPVIVLTGQGDIGIAVQAMKNGAFEFLEKPYKNEILLETLAEAFEMLEQTVQETSHAAYARALASSRVRRDAEIFWQPLVFWPAHNGEKSPIPLL